MFDLENGSNENLRNVVMPRFDLAQSKKVESVDDDTTDSIAKQISTVFSASGISALMSHPEMDSLPTAGQQYVQRKFESRKSGTFNHFSTKATEHGNKFELKAIEAFIEKTGFDVLHTGENQRTLKYGGSTVAHPDGWIYMELDNINFHEISATVEAKCPYNREIHESYLGITDAQSLKSIAPNYYWQIACQQLCADCDLTYFISFDPKPNDGVPQLHYAKIAIPCDDIAFMKRRIALAEDYLHLLENEAANTVAFKPSDAPIIEIAQLPRVQIDITEVAFYHDEPATLVQKIAQQAGSLVFDMTTAKGRDACRSHAAQIIKCIKPALDASRQLAADAKRVIDKDLSFRKEFEKGVREIADHHRKPLTEWEAEQERIEREKREEEERLAAIAQAEIDYQAAHESALVENELFDLRREKQAREQAEREAQAIAQAVKVAQERIEYEQAMQAQLDRERAENEAHRKAVHNEIFKALCENGIEREIAKTVVTLAIEQKLGRLQIAY